jgi:hypothetical protein
VAEGHGYPLELVALFFQEIYILKKDISSSSDGMNLATFVYIFQMNPFIKI